MQLVSKVPLVLPSVRIQLLQNKDTSYAPIAAEITLHYRDSVTPKAEQSKDGERALKTGRDSAYG